MEKKPIKKKETKSKSKETDLDLNKVEASTSSQGLGDVIAKVTSAIGITQCEPCKQRQKNLNRIFPFTKEANEIFEDDVLFVKELNETKYIKQDNRKRFEQLVRDTFEVRFTPCNCPAKYKEWLEKLVIQVGYQEEGIPKDNEN